MGAREIPRSTFTATVARLVRQPAVPAPWVLDADFSATRL
jgi:hypothetical protein